jgi:transcription antitermination factor NusG
MNAKQILEKALETVDLKKPKTIVEAANTALGLNNVKVGGDVAIIDDPTFPTAGLKGKVKKIDTDSGLATVQLHNGDEVPLQVNQLIAL